MKKQKTNQQGITLIALVVTIVILIILAGVSINLMIGKNGIISKAISAKEQMLISEGKERIDLALTELTIDKIEKEEPCTLEYIGANLESKAKGLKVIGIKGNPVVKLYVSYKDYIFKISDKFEVIAVGNINIEEQPDIEIIQDTTITGVESVNLTIKAKIEQGEISEIVKPNGEIEYKNEIQYRVTENGEYKFKAVSEKGIIEEKIIEIKSIKQEGIEIGTSGGGNEEVICSHIYEKKYDETNHWEQCILCNNKISIINHNIEILGTAGCSTSLGEQTKYCTNGCGYNVKLPKEPHLECTWKPAPAEYGHRYNCNKCNANTGQVRCKDKDGNKIGCDTGIGGTCITCGYNYTSIKHATIRSGKCASCVKEFYKLTFNVEIIGEMKTKYTWHIYNIISGLEIIDKPGEAMIVPGGGVKILEGNFTKNQDNTIDIVRVFETTKETTTGAIQVGAVMKYIYNGQSGGCVDYSNKLLKSDNYAPVKQSITVEGANQGTEFSRKATITAKFEETWDDIVQMALYDDKGTVISNWGAATKEGTIFTREFNVVTETTTTKELTVKAKDRCGNIAEGKVTIGKIDTKSPTLVSKDKYNDIWSINKEINIEATDEGSGEVEIALGDIKDYQKANKNENRYTRGYRIIGDLYEDIVRIVYLKDGVGNVTTNRITIGKVDSTSPTITNIKQEPISEGIKITIDANDINKKLNKDGSGIYGYVVSKSKEVPHKNNFQKNNIINVKEQGTYYIYVLDNAGNVSERREIQI